MTEKLPFSQWNPIIAEDFVKRWEGLRLKAYHCTASTLTIGYGHTKNVKPGQTITKAEAERLLRDDLVEHAQALAPAVTCKLTEGQYIALLDLAFNVGVSAVAKSKTLEYLNAGLLEKAKEGFLSFAKQKVRTPDGQIKYDHGKPVYITLTGLLNRRKAEVELM
ncbi:lysozyme [uncultured Parasutterella sp.]|uniref:lysozyme n=1 Tax=uncultured Parasutterella sp. TaxID=1263098 RepID=UPI00272D46A0|nr:lysozyme [uncultured Parasutterella sp.]